MQHLVLQCHLTAGVIPFFVDNQPTQAKYTGLDHAKVADEFALQSKEHDPEGAAVFDHELVIGRYLHLPRYGELSRTLALSADQAYEIPICIENLDLAIRDIGHIDLAVFGHYKNAELSQ